MDHHHLARTIAVLRVAIGAVALAAPRTASRPLVGNDATKATTKLLTRLFGVRDLAVGLGTLNALRENRDPKAWVQIGALCDAGDTVSMALGARSLPKLRIIAALASSAAAAATGWRASARMTRG